MASRASGCWDFCKKPMTKRIKIINYDREEESLTKNLDFKNSNEKVALAYIESFLHPSENYYANNNRNPNTTHQFTIRYNKPLWDFLAVFTDKKIIEYNGNQFKILQIDNLNEDNRVITMLVNKKGSITSKTARL